MQPVDAMESIEAIVRTILDPTGRPRTRNPVPDPEVTTEYVHDPKITLKGGAPGTAIEAKVTAGSFVRNKRGPTEAIALARLLLAVEDELITRLDAGHACIERQMGALRAARTLIANDAATRKAVG